ncbi:hypothetical protein F5879DRAFT_66190 [Lentinula edodes]|uniref:uncharacterized protein n=1 Tax=Lentinula edodes TaxID=5353 RepID=UPI001E8EBE86|nr:uncharacterized protein C8R40DRAFT_895544 [Lentinula edodes]KAH7877458.1 hypothetical protein C8R40DRAFT_895544 [Lentinula edodes]KAJ3904525.1 hypothetical protein F5879DRAFT_66190 [Lentinula edodes]
MSNDDPRDASLESKFVLPNTWYRDDADSLSTSGVFFSGLVMVTRNRYLAWPGVLFALNSAINQHTLRAKEGSGGALGNLTLSFMALLASYIPFVTVTATKIS